jgi:hypothetical protein
MKLDFTDSVTAVDAAASAPRATQTATKVRRKHLINSYAPFASFTASSA